MNTQTRRLLYLALLAALALPVLCLLLPQKNRQPPDRVSSIRAEQTEKMQDEPRRTPAPDSERWEGVTVEEKELLLEELGVSKTTVSERIGEVPISLPEALEQKLLQYETMSDEQKKQLEAELREHLLSSQEVKAIQEALEKAFAEQEASLKSPAAGLDCSE